MPVTNYIWDVVGDNYLMETDGNGATTAVYTNEPDPFGKLISQRRNSATSYHHFDAQQSTRELTDADEAVTDTYTYKAFGETSASSGTTTNPFRYIGRPGYYYDRETADYYIRARAYSPATGQFISPDPLGFAVGDGNLYRYVCNNPINATDPTGEIGIVEIIVGGCIVVGAVVIGGCRRRPSAPTPKRTYAGTFNITMQTLQVTEPDEILILGQATRGYVVQYVPPSPNPCPGGKIIIVQAVEHYNPKFDGPADPQFVRWPEYEGQKPSQYTIADGPAAPILFKQWVWKNTICAVCVKERPTFSQKILGCVNIVWYDRDRELKASGIKTRSGKTDKITNIPAEAPGPTWHAAVANYHPTEGDED
jgi:RHS repeat-associated protein